MRFFVCLELIGYEGEEVGGREREWSLISKGKPNLEGDRFGNGKPKRSLTNDRTKLGVERLSHYKKRGL